MCQKNSRNEPDQSYTTAQPTTWELSILTEQASPSLINEVQRRLQAGYKSHFNICGLCSIPRLHVQSKIAINFPLSPSQMT